MDTSGLTYPDANLSEMLDTWRIVEGSGVGTLKDYTERLGWDIYSEVSETGLASYIVEAHAAFALLGSDVTLAGQPEIAISADSVDLEDAPEQALPIDVEQLAIRLVAQGSPALIKNEYLNDTQLLQVEARGYDPRAEAYSFIDGVVYDALKPNAELRTQKFPPFTRRGFAQCFYIQTSEGAKKCTRIFTRLPDGTWDVGDWLNYTTKERRRINNMTLPADGVIAEPWGLGWLFKAQKLIHRLENIFISMERLQSGVNSKTIILGYIGNLEQARREMNRTDTDAVNLPSGTQVSRVASTAQIDQLISEFALRIERLMATVHLVSVSDKTHITDSRTLWQTVPMVSKTQQLQNQVARVIAQAGMRASFVELQAESVDERTAKFGLALQMKAANVIDDTRLQKVGASLL